MKAKENISANLALTFCIFVFILFLIPFLPFFLLFLLFKILATPFDYIKYKRSCYQQDFPHKYKWANEPHTDNVPYTAIKKNNLPVEYIKWHEDYDMLGYFVYQDTMLVFHEPLFFDEKKGLWLWWPGEKEEEPTTEESENEESYDADNTDDCLSVEDLKEFLLDDFRNHVSGRECKKVVFFYSRKKVEKIDGKIALEKMRELDDFIIYKNGQLAEAIQKMIDTHQ